MSIDDEFKIWLNLLIVYAIKVCESCDSYNNIDRITEHWINWWKLNVIFAWLKCRAWGVNCGTFEPQYGSWREMYLERPRLRYNGCYISKTSYIRHGENSFQDQFYRPWHLVEYFRYLRWDRDWRYRYFPHNESGFLNVFDESLKSASFVPPGFFRRVGFSCWHQPTKLRAVLTLSNIELQGTLQYWLVITGCTKTVLYWYWKARKQRRTTCTEGKGETRFTTAGSRLTTWYYFALTLFCFSWWK